MINEEEEENGDDDDDDEEEEEEEIGDDDWRAHRRGKMWPVGNAYCDPQEESSRDWGSFFFLQLELVLNEINSVNPQNQKMNQCHDIWPQ